MRACVCGLIVADLILFVYAIFFLASSIHFLTWFDSHFAWFFFLILCFVFDWNGRLGFGDFISGFARSPF